MEARVAALRAQVLAGDLAPATLRDLADATEAMEASAAAAAMLVVGNTVRVLVDGAKSARRAMISDVNDNGTLDVVFEGGYPDEATVPASAASPLLDFEVEEDPSPPEAEELKARGSALFQAKDHIAASRQYEAALAVLKRASSPLATGSSVLVSTEKFGLRVGTVTGRDEAAKTVDVMYEDEEEELADDDDLPLRRVVALVAPVAKARRLQVACYLNLARCATTVGRHRDAVAAATLAGGLAGPGAANRDHFITAKILRARANLAQSHLKPALRDSAVLTDLDPANKAVILLARDADRAKRAALKANKQLAKEVTSWVASAQEKYTEAGGDENGASCQQQ